MVARGQPRFAADPRCCTHVWRSNRHGHRLAEGLLSRCFHPTRPLSLSDLGRVPEGHPEIAQRFRGCLAASWRCDRKWHGERVGKSAPVGFAEYVPWKGQLAPVVQVFTAKRLYPTAQGRGASPRTLGKRCGSRVGRAEDYAPSPRVPRPKYAASRAGMRRAAGRCGLGERRCVSWSRTRPMRVGNILDPGCAAKRVDPGLWGLTPSA
jgi:hypothetical protein